MNYWKAEGFSDEDLKRLKEVIGYAKFPSVSAFELKALLARLEASELCVRYYQSHFIAGCVAPVEREALKAWRKAAGK